MADEIYTVAQTAQYLKVCEKTVRRLIKTNKLTASRVGTGNRSLRIKRADIDYYLETHTNNSERATTSLPPFMIKTVKITRPIDESGDPDISIQNEIAKKYLALEQY